ncbi:Na+/H+ antiporter subunit G [Pseudooceanicola sp. C21-150M6]|uniref:Na+/H+ antiporter subunit G n=1 Tax=Pseudooceanicola sp. C21-150M6 TaxID=3434355 RepID=UPI003D7F8038
MTPEILEILIAATIVIGAAFTLVGSVGLVKLTNPMSRLHAPTKAGTLGVGGLLVASVLFSILRGEPSLHELLIMAFLFVTAPISAHFIAKVHIHRNHTRQELPDPPRDTVWATKEIDADRPPAA